MHTHSTWNKESWIDKTGNNRGIRGENHRDALFQFKKIVITEDSMLKTLHVFSLLLFSLFLVKRVLTAAGE